MVERRFRYLMMHRENNLLVLNRYQPLWIAAFCFALTTASKADPPPIGFRVDQNHNVVYPECSAVVNVKRAPYLAKGDGITDDTNAIQQALFDAMGQHKLLYFPNGIYSVSRTLQWSKKNSAGKEAWGNNFLLGQDAVKTVIRLKDATFTDQKQPSSIMWCGGFGSADWFHNYVENMTFDVGRDNPGAIALQFYSNNSGAVRNCRFVAEKGSGLVGLDLGHRDMNGPLLVRNCEVIGFERGVITANAVNGQTFEHVTLSGQSKFGFDNEGQTISIRGLRSDNAVPAIRTYGTLCVTDSRLAGRDGAGRWPAIINYNGGRLFVRGVETSEYGRAVGSVTTPDWFAATHIGGNEPESAGPTIIWYSSHPTTSLFASGSPSPPLAIKEPPEVLVDDPLTWCNVDSFGADPTGIKDSSQAIQKSIDSGATTIFLPGSYRLGSSVVIRGKARRIVGLGGSIDYEKRVTPDFRIVDGASSVVSLEHFAYIHGGVEIDTHRTIIFRSVSDCDLINTARAEGGELFLEDFVTHSLMIKKQGVWARQLNIENEGTHIVNDAGRLWVLGYKTERGGTLLATRGGGRSEVFGGLSYTTTAGRLAPMFINEDSFVFAFFGEVCFNGDPFETMIQETRQHITKIVKRGEGGTTPYVASVAPH